MASKKQTNDCDRNSASSKEAWFAPTNMANEEIRDLLLDYVKEVADPVLRAQRDKEIIEDERRKGYEVTLFCPEPCYVLKTSIQLKCESNHVTKKGFINICQNDAIEKPSCKRVSQALTKSFYNQDSGLFWTVPHGLTYPRDDTDRRAAFCVVYDCVYHPDTIRLANSNKHFKKMIEEFALDAVENSFNVKLDRTFVKYPKMKFKGKPVTTMMRKKLSLESIDQRCERLNFCDQALESSGQIQETIQISRTEERRVENSVDTKHGDTSIQKSSIITVPKYFIKYCYQSDILNYAYDMSRTVITPWPVTLNVEVYLPEIKSVESLELEIDENMLSLKTSSGVTPQYELSIQLPYCVNDDEGTARFSTENEVLCVELPVLKPKTECLHELHTTDSININDRTSKSAPVVVEDEALVAGFEQKLTLEPSEVKISNDGAQKADDFCIAEGNVEEKQTNGCKSLSVSNTTCVPRFSCHQSNEELIFVIMTERVIRETLNVVYFENGSKCHITYLTVSEEEGSNLTSYSLYLQFLTDCRLDPNGENVNVSEENVVIIFKKCDDSKYYWDGFHYGADANSAQNYEILVLNALQRKLNILQNEFSSSRSCVAAASTNSQNANVTEITPERLTVEIEDGETEVKAAIVSDEMPPSKKDVESGSSEQSSNQSQACSRDENSELPVNKMTSKKKDTSGFIIAIGAPRKSRSFSDSSDDMSTCNLPRSILKAGLRSRTRSESSDDYCWQTQDYTSLDSDIPEEELMGNIPSIKKSVHFNDVIYHNFFRTNCSILIERKKNQRKQRKQRNSLSRRTSESENSEGEVDNRGSCTNSNLSQLYGRKNAQSNQFNTWCSNNHNDVSTNDLNAIRDANFTMDCINDNESFNEINQNTSGSNCGQRLRKGRTSRGRSKRNRGHRKGK